MVKSAVESRPSVHQWILGENLGVSVFWHTSNYTSVCRVSQAHHTLAAASYVDLR